MKTRQKRESGQSAVMVSLLLIIVAMIIAFTTNVGKLVTERIAMQNAVDLAAYSGAATQAGYLNELRKINNDIWKIHNETRQRLEPSEGTVGNTFFFGGPRPPCSPCCGPNAYPLEPTGVRAFQAEMYIGQQKIALERKFFDFDRVNRMAPNKVKTAVEKAAKENYKGTDQYVKIISPNSGELMPVQQHTIDWSYKGWVMVLPSPFCPSGPSGSSFITEHKPKSWFYRKPGRGEIMLAAGIEGASPASPFLDSFSNSAILNSYFTGDCKKGSMRGGRCPLDTYAAAHPHHGKIGSVHGGRAPWEMMWDIQTNMPIPTTVDRSAPLNAHKVFGGSYYDYKVRFIGIFENNAEFVGSGQRLTQAIEGRNPGSNGKWKH